MILSSLLVCLVRDPGNPSAASHIDGAKGDPDEMGLREALLSDDDYSSPNKWCRKCWVSIFVRNSAFHDFDLLSSLLNRHLNLKEHITAQSVEDVF